MNVSKKRKSNETVTSIPTKRIFLDLNATDQSIKIVEWLTNKTPTEILRKKVSYGDIIQDSNIFIFKPYGVYLNGVNKLVDRKCFSYLNSEVDRLNSLMWGCTKCK